MYEIFGNGEAVTVRKNNSIPKPHLSSSIPIKGELNQKLRPLSLGSSKIVLGDVSNKVKNTLTADTQSHLRSLSPNKSIKKTLFSEGLIHGGHSAKESGIQISRRDKSPKKVKTQFTPKPTAKSSTLGATKVSIFVDTWNDGCQEPSDPELDEVFLPSQNELDTCDLDVSPQKIYGCCEGCETPDDSAGGWLLEPLWDNKDDLARIINLEPSPEIEPDFPGVEHFSAQNPTDENNFDELFEVDDPCYPEPLIDDVPLADLEW
ncbi:uncharacterized protein LOC124595614 [Schistocerca americana]|uniref:uncharacterized protein LOC124595614 n=1 Tax=Schistocerca americana TaxID=7009 RepID=UPI001F4F372F|nr:uncharacterized protein LOC124595614 [Schistocerca americana]